MVTATTLANPQCVWFLPPQSSLLEESTWSVNYIPYFPSLKPSKDLLLNQNKVQLLPLVLRALPDLAAICPCSPRPCALAPVLPSQWLVTASTQTKLLPRSGPFCCERACWGSSPDFLIFRIQLIRCLHRELVPDHPLNWSSLNPLPLRLLHPEVIIFVTLTISSRILLEYNIRI